MRKRLADLVNQIPDNEYQFLPNEDRRRTFLSADLTERRGPAKKYRRVQLGAESEAEEEVTQDTSLESSDDDEKGKITKPPQNSAVSGRKRLARSQAAGYFDEEAEEEATVSDSDSEIDTPSDASFVAPDELFL